MTGNPAAAADVGGDDFARQVRDALAHLYDPAYLQTHPLVALVPADPGARATGRGKALRQIVVEAIEATGPIGTADRAIPGRLIHQVLTLRYVEALDPSVVQERLDVSRSEYYCEHQRGVDAVVSLLGSAGAAWGRRGDPLPLHPANPTGVSGTRPWLPATIFPPSSRASSGASARLGSSKSGCGPPAC
jgi:hypothetical protein